MGKLRRLIKTIFEASDRIATEKEVTRQEAVSLATTAHNRHTGVKGFSPYQWAFGRNPDLLGSVVKADEERECGMSMRGLEELERWRRKADEAYRMAQGKEVLNAARNKRGYRTEFYNPGDLVYFWKEGAKVGGIV